MESTAKLRYIRIAPRKVRLVADVIRGKRADEARLLLRMSVKGAGEPLQKMLKSALTNAQQKFQGEEANLYIAKIVVDEGPKLKRFRPRARGRAYPIQKKTSHITLTLTEIVPSGEQILQEKPEKGKASAKATEAETKTETSAGATAREKTVRPKQTFRAKKTEKENTKRGGAAKRVFRRKAV